MAVIGKISFLHQLNRVTKDTNESTSTTLDQDGREDLGSVIEPMTMPSTSYSRTGIPKTKPSVESCPGYELQFKNGVPAIAHYPLSLHMTQSLTWNVTIDRTRVILFSQDCSKESRAPKSISTKDSSGKSDKPEKMSTSTTRLPCTSCQPGQSLNCYGYACPCS
jgi:hypothetical protein